MASVWGLYSTYVDPMHAPELLEVFASSEQALQAREGLADKPRQQDRLGRVYGTWVLIGDDPDGDFSDLHVRPLELR